MYAIAFNLKIDDLKREYGDPYNGAYDEIRRELTTLGFDWTQGSVYVSNSEKDSLTTVYKAIIKLSNIGSFGQPLYHGVHRNSASYHRNPRP